MYGSVRVPPEVETTIELTPGNPVGVVNISDVEEFDTIFPSTPPTFTLAPSSCIPAILTLVPPSVLPNSGVYAVARGLESNSKVMVAEPAQPSIRTVAIPLPRMGVIKTTLVLSASRTSAELLSKYRLLVRLLPETSTLVPPTNGTTFGEMLFKVGAMLGA